MYLDKIREDISRTFERLPPTTIVADVQIPELLLLFATKNKEFKSRGRVEITQQIQNPVLANVPLSLFLLLSFS